MQFFYSKSFICLKANTGAYYSGFQPTFCPLTLFLALLSGITCAVAQKIHFIDTTNKWTTYLSTDYLTSYHGYVHYFFDGGDFNTGIYDYFSFWCSIDSAPFFIREDTLAGIVYINLGSEFTGPSDTDKVLYNYNLLVGDTIHFTYNSSTFHPFVDSVIGLDSIIMNGVYHKVFSLMEIDTFHIHDCGYNPFLTYIEGIGSMFAPAFRVDNYHQCDSERLLCFSNQTGSPMVNVPFIFQNYSDTAHFLNNCAALSTDEIKQANILSVSPNPATNELLVSSPAKISSLVIYNCLGQLVHSHEYDSKQVKVNISDLAAGVYVLKINGPDGYRREVRKFVKE